MYPTDTPAISDGTSTHIYSIVKMGDYECVRREAAAPSDQPSTLTIKHTVTGKGLAKQVSSLIRFDDVVEDAAGNQGIVSCYSVLKWPPNITTAATAQKTLNKKLAFWAIATYKDKATNLEI